MFPSHFRSPPLTTQHFLFQTHSCDQRTGEGLISFYHVEYLTQAPTEEMFLSSSDLLHKPGLSKALIIYTGTGVVCIFYKKMLLCLTSFRRGHNTKFEDWYLHSACNQSTRFFGWLLTCFKLGKKPQHFYKGQRSMVHAILGISARSVMWGEILEKCWPGESCARYNIGERKWFCFTPKSFEGL